MTLKRVEEPRCANGENCVAYPALGEPSKLSRGNPGPGCFACEERRAASKLKADAAREEEAVERRRANEPRLSRSNRLEERTQGGRAYEVLERRRMSVLTCKRGLRSALASGDEPLARTWSRSLRDAEIRLVWAEADLHAAETRAQSAFTR
jgi:hypothetical protein